MCQYLAFAGTEAKAALLNPAELCSELQRSVYVCNFEIKSIFNHEKLKILEVLVRPEDGIVKNCS